MGVFLSIYRTKPAWLVEHAGFVVVPLLVLNALPGNRAVEYGAMAASAAYMVVVSFIAGARPPAIGLTSHCFSAAIRFLLLPTLLAAGLILLGKT